jgi:hypothetical protein
MPASGRVELLKSASAVLAPKEAMVRINLDEPSVAQQVAARISPAHRLLKFLSGQFP